MKQKFTKEQLLDALVKVKSEFPRPHITSTDQYDLLVSMNEKLDLLLKENTALRNRVSDLEGVIKIQGEIIEAHERLFRRRNIIIHGVDEESSDCTRNDMIAYISKSLKVDLDIANDCESISRLGKISPNKSRPIRVTLYDSYKRFLILSRAKNLREIRDLTNIYINADLTPQQQSANKKLRELRDRIRSKPENKGKNVYIYKSSVYINNDRVDESLFL